MFENNENKQKECRFGLFQKSLLLTLWNVALLSVGDVVGQLAEQLQLRRYVYGPGARDVRYIVLKLKD